MNRFNYANLRDNVNSTVKFQSLSEEEFLNSGFSPLFGNPSKSRAFGLISGGNIEFKIAWQSDLLVPDLLELPKENLLVGIDFNVAIINLNSGKVQCQFTLDSFYKESVIHKGVVFVFTDQKVLKIGIESFELLGTIYLPDLYQDHYIQGSKLWVQVEGVEWEDIEL